MSDYQGVEKWKREAQDLLVATAEQAGINPPDIILREPGRLCSTFETLLDSVPIDDLSEDEFYTLGTQLVALIAQVLMVEDDAAWVLEGDPKSISAGRHVLARTEDSEPRPYRVDPFLLVKAELDSEQPDLNRLLEQAHTMISWCHPRVPDE